jgi:hypothetical protein
MTGDRIRVPLQLRCQFRCQRFAVLPALMGKSHEFEFAESRVIITLPNISEVGDINSSQPKAVCQAWRPVNGENIPSNYDIYRVEIKVISNAVPAIHPDMLNLNINQYGLIDEEEQQALDDLGNSNFSLAVAAYEYWLAVLRWKTGDHQIGREATVGNAVGQSPRLHTVDTEKAVWVSMAVINFGASHKTTLKEWEACEVALQNNEKVPEHIILLQDGQENHQRLDYRRSLIDIAIACEIYLRFKVLSSMPESLLPSLRVAIESMNINQYATKFFPEILDTDGKAAYRKINKGLASLFDLRNKIMHMHNNERATSEQCVRFIDLAKDLFQLDLNISLQTDPSI